jgi:hypothetical protein
VFNLTRQPEKRIRSRTVLVGVMIAALVVVWLAWSQWDALREVLGGPDDAAAEPVTPVVPEEGTVAAGDEGPGEAAQRWAALLGRQPEWPADLAAPSDCRAVEADLARICAVLDSRAYLAGGQVSGGSCGLLQQTAAELAARPPVLSSELRSYESILSNVFHLFRVLGRDRVGLLRRIVGEERQLAEPVAMALFRWMMSRESCARSGRTPIRLAAMYDYAGFLFQTMGGQAYLRRRAPETEALVAFYALLILDRAERDGHNPHGVDPRPEIDRTRALLSSQDLVFSRRYVETLDEMAGRWKNRDPTD